MSAPGYQAEAWSPSGPRNWRPNTPVLHPLLDHALRCTDGMSHHAPAPRRAFAEIGLVAAILVALAATAPQARAACIDEGKAEAMGGAALKPPAPADARAPRLNLLTLVQSAVKRSNAVGAARLLAEAAEEDRKEAAAGRLPVVSVGGTTGGIDSQTDPAPSSKGNQVQATFTLSAPLYDGGRVNALTGWRGHLAEAARLGQLTAQEQVALQTVSLALDRSRFQVQAQVYAQYAQKMSCLVDALQTIVNADRGRASELVQARKNQQQAELARAQTLSQVRVNETRLRRFVGDALPASDGMSSVMLDVPPLNDMLAMAERSSEIGALGEQADALEAYVRAVLAGDRPQVSWLVSASKVNGASNGHSVAAGVNFNVPLFSAATAYQTNAARKRAEAARLQKLDALEARKERMTEVYEQATASLDRAHKVALVVHDSDLLRNFTMQQWQQLGRRSLFDVMSAEGDHYNLRIEYVNALYDAQQANALLWSLGTGLVVKLE